MFTGIVQGVGRVAGVESIGGDVRLRIAAGPVSLEGVGIGDSIAVNGACLTAVEIDRGGFAADVSRETLSMTTLGELAAGSPVNLENALRAGQALGGHYVSGHVDGVGQVLSRRDDARSVRIEFEVPPGLGRYLARKGSICVDGVSLTVNSAEGARFDVNMVPHTLEVTTLGRLVAGTRVNLEVDIIARYLERLLVESR